MNALRASILGLLLAPNLAGQPEVPPADVQLELCERALRVGGSLESYLEGLGSADPVAVGKARALLESLRGAYPELPESYLKLAVLMAAESGTEATSDAAETTLRLLERCGEDPRPAESPELLPETPVTPEPGVSPEPVPPVEATPAAPPEAPPALPESPDLAADFSPRDLFFEGVALAERGAFEEAKAIFRSLTRTYPQLPEPFVNLGVLLAAEGDADQAGRMVEGALFAHPVCRAAFELTLIPKLSAHSYAVLADLGREGPDRVARPLPETSADVRAVAETVAAWSRAWSEKRLEDYVGFYGAGFQPPAGSRGRWLAELRARREGLQSAGLEDLSVDLTGPGKATAWFTYRARTLTGAGEVARKTLELEKVGTAWKIVAERGGG